MFTFNHIFLSAQAVSLPKKREMHGLLAELVQVTTNPVSQTHGNSEITNLITTCQYGIVFNKIKASQARLGVIRNMPH